MQAPPPVPSPRLKPASIQKDANTAAKTVTPSTTTTPSVKNADPFVQFAKALFDFPAHEPDELYFEEEDVIMIPSHTTSNGFRAHAKAADCGGWLYGENNGSWGWFPVSYVRLLSEAEVVAEISNNESYRTKPKPKPVIADSMDSMFTHPGDVKPKAVSGLGKLEEGMDQAEDEDDDDAPLGDPEDAISVPAHNQTRYYLALQAALATPTPDETASESASHKPTAETTQIPNHEESPQLVLDQEISTPSIQRRTWLPKLRRMSGSSSSASSATKLKVAATSSATAVATLNADTTNSTAQSLPSDSKAHFNPTDSDISSMVSDTASFVSTSRDAALGVASGQPPPTPTPTHAEASIPTQQHEPKTTAISSSKTVAIVGQPMGLKKLWIDHIGGADVLEGLGISKTEKQRQEVIYEMITTERDYVGDLEIILNVFLAKCRGAKVLRPKDVAVIFSNLEAILNVNKELLMRLEERQAKHGDGVIEQVGDIFIGVTDYLKMYNMYCSNHPYALMKLQAVRQTKSVAKLLDSLKALPECRNLDLSNFLLKPVQRICKYPLLVREAIKCTDKTHPDFENLTKALAKIETVVTIVNEGSRQAESVQKMLDIQARLTVKHNIVMPSRILKKHGPIDYINKKGDRKRCELYLFNDVLLLAKPQNTSTNNHANDSIANSTNPASTEKLKLMAMVPFDMILINCPNASAVDVKVTKGSTGKEVHLIEVVHVNSAKFYLAVDSPTVKASWVKALQEATEEWLSCRQRMNAAAVVSPKVKADMISAPIGVQVVSGKGVESLVSLEAAAAAPSSVHLLVPAAPPPPPPSSPVRQPTSMSTSPRRNVTAPVPIGSLASDAAKSLEKMKEKRAKNQSSDSISISSNHQSVASLREPSTLPSDSDDDDKALSSAAGSRPSTPKFSASSTDLVQLKASLHKPKHASSETVAYSESSSNSSLHQSHQEPPQTAEPTRVAPTSRLALNTFIVQDQSKVHHGPPSASSGHKRPAGGIPHSSSLSNTYTAHACGDDVEVTSSLPAFKSFASKDSIPPSQAVEPADESHVLNSSVVSLPVASPVAQEPIQKESSPLKTRASTETAPITTKMTHTDIQTEDRTHTHHLPLGDANTFKHGRSFSHQLPASLSQPGPMMMQPTQQAPAGTQPMLMKPPHSVTTSQSAIDVGSVQAVSPTRTSGYTGVRARKEMLLRCAFSGVESSVTRAHEIRAEATGETGLSAVVPIPIVKRETAVVSGFEKMAIHAPLTSSMVTMNEEVGENDDTEGGELVEKLQMNKPVRKLVFHSVVQKTGRNAKDFIYVIRVYHQTGQYSVIHHTFDDLFEFHTHLVAEFPDDAGVTSGSVRILPEFPPQMMFVSEAVARIRLSLLQQYAAVVVSLPVRISRSPYVMRFFRMDGRHAAMLMAPSQTGDGIARDGVPVTVGIW
ncbi:Rho guanine nucleotide exchange factor 4 [Chytriomyces hyalinus]|nr:Rho guanine nucleotide exchange factor 4 [Chytriomyces hyalinus]